MMRCFNDPALPPKKYEKKFGERDLERDEQDLLSHLNVRCYGSLFFQLLFAFGFIYRPSHILVPDGLVCVVRRMRFVIQYYGAMK